MMDGQACLLFSDSGRTCQCLTERSLHAVCAGVTRREAVLLRDIYEEAASYQEVTFTCMFACGLVCRVLAKL